MVAILSQFLTVITFFSSLKSPSIIKIPQGFLRVSLLEKLTSPAFKI